MAVPLLLLLVAGCAATSVQDVPMPDQNLRVESPWLCRVYFFREDVTVVNHQPVRVEIDGKRIGVLGPGRYLCTEVRPGSRQVQTVLTITGHPDRQDVDTLVCEAGGVLHLLIRFPFERNRRPLLVVLDPVAARDAMARLEPAPTR
jgi:hypothetical protein